MGLLLGRRKIEPPQLCGILLPLDLAGNWTTWLQKLSVRICVQYLLFIHTHVPAKRVCVCAYVSLWGKGVSRLNSLHHLCHWMTLRKLVALPRLFCQLEQGAENTPQGVCEIPVNSPGMHSFPRRLSWVFWGCWWPDSYRPVWIQQIPSLLFPIPPYIVYIFLVITPGRNRWGQSQNQSGFNPPHIVWGEGQRKAQCPSRSHNLNPGL